MFMKASQTQEQLKLKKKVTTIRKFKESEKSRIFNLNQKDTLWDFSDEPKLTTSHYLSKL